MNTKRRIYLDNAATSWPKPEVVYQAVDHYQREIGAAAGRSSFEHAQQSQRVVANARHNCARLLGIPNSNQLAFTANGTAALNYAIHGLLKDGDHVVTTVCEHNSVLRPLNAQVENNGVEVSFVGCDALGFVDPDEIAQAMRLNTRLVAVVHASNVTGAVQPIARIAQVAHNHDALLLVDAAQTVGCLPTDVTKLDVDLLAAGGHKGLLGPLGTGILYVSDSLAQHQLRPLMQGGTGTHSQHETQPATMPDRFESGNLNVPALAGFAAAVEYLQDESVQKIHDQHRILTTQLIDGLSSIEGVRLVGPGCNQQRVSVVSFAVDGYDPQEFAGILDASGGVECRAGLHCAPRMHAALGSEKSGGLVRLSPGWCTTEEDINDALNAIASFAAMTAH